MSSPHLAIVIPAYNEEHRIGTTLALLTDFLRQQPWPWEIRVVDDGSTDGTCEAVLAFSHSDPRVLLQREGHRGKGGAVRAGMLAASGEYRFICDADLSMPPRELTRFLPPELGDADVAIGSREGAGARRIGEPLLRHLAGRGFNLLVRTLMVPGIQDTQCGFKMFTARAVEAVFPSVTVDGWAFDIEVLYLARMRGLKVREIPIEWHYRAASRLHMFRDGVGMFRELLRIRRRARRHEYDRG